MQIPTVTIETTSKFDSPVGSIDYLHVVGAGSLIVDNCEVGRLDFLVLVDHGVSFDVDCMGLWEVAVLSAFVTAVQL